MSDLSKKVVVRFPPSPTGDLHVGSARTALFNYLFAKKMGGLLVLRIEDTDTARSEKRFEENILEGLSWLGITYDSFSRQSERTEKYTEALQTLVQNNKAYISREPAKDGNGEVEVVRFKNPNTTVTFTDLVRGEISFDTSDLGDFVIAKSMTEPLYHLAVVVDDFDMNVTHIIRGEDGISNTPRQILIQEALGAPRPQYAHIPLLLGADRSKLSKRHGARPITDLRDEGFLPEAVLNHLAFLGWNPGDEREVLNIPTITELFSLEKIQKGGAIWSVEKLEWYNAEYLKKLSTDELYTIAKPYIPSRITTFETYSVEKMKSILGILTERDVKKLTDITHILSGDYCDYFFVAPKPSLEKILFKTQTKEVMQGHLVRVKELISAISETDFTSSTIKDTLWDYATNEGRGDVLWPLRVALTGKEKSPDPFSVAHILGKEETLSRISYATSL